jgi:hypothetical protein
VGGHAACEAPQAAEDGDDGEGGAVAGPGEFGGANGDVGVDADVVVVGVDYLEEGGEGCDVVVL